MPVARRFVAFSVDYDVITPRFRRNSDGRTHAKVTRSYVSSNLRQLTTVVIKLRRSDDFFEVRRHFYRHPGLLSPPTPLGPERHHHGVDQTAGALREAQGRGVVAHQQPQTERQRLVRALQKAGTACVRHEPQRVHRPHVHGRAAHGVAGAVDERGHRLVQARRRLHPAHLTSR
eukprot:9469817-Pyramimonas_sp.AAC.1